MSSADEYERITKAAEVTWPQNGLLHAYNEGIKAGEKLHLELLRECLEAFKQIIEDTDDRNSHDVIAICNNFITKLNEALNDTDS
jgi:hypothetical protein